MLFGDPAVFAIEAIIEPGPEFSTFFGNNITGRLRLFFGGLEVGDFTEPSCVLRPLSQHLVVQSAIAHALWHESLVGESPATWFKILNDSLYLNGLPKPNDAYRSMDFLTNVSEALDNVKGFLVVPPNGPMQALIQLPDSEVVHQHAIPLSKFCAVSSQFAAWIAEQENQILQDSI
jgi:hypothetical protein